MLPFLSAVCARWRCGRSCAPRCSRVAGGALHCTPLWRTPAAASSSSADAASTSASSARRPTVRAGSSTRAPGPSHAFHSTAPPFRLLSWEVDAMESSHRHWRRRLPFAQRLPWIVETIIQCAPDVVALQNSNPALAHALCASEPQTTAAPDVTTRLTLMHAELLDRLTPSPSPAETTEAVNAHDADPTVTASPSVSTPARPRYTLIGAAENGRCGQVQLFVRVGCGLEARVVPSGPGVSARLRWVEAESGDAASPPQGTSPRHAPSPVEFILSTVDLSYRGKSVALDGHALTTAEVSLDGSPFTLTTPSADVSASSSSVSSSRPRGQMDHHRAAALSFLTRVVQPDIICGNLYMGHDESVPFFEDAWHRAGAPAAQERTTDTRRPHRQLRTNYFYFVPSPPTEKAAPGRAARTSTHRGHTRREGDKAKDGSSAGTDDAPDAAPFSPPAIGTPLPLTSTFDAVHCTWSVPKSEDVAETPGNTTHIDPSDKTDAESPPLTLTVPEVAGRFQRCLIAQGQSTRTHTRHYSLLRRYRRCRVVVVKPFIEAPVPEDWEIAWHRAQLLHSRRRQLERRRFALQRKRHYLQTHSTAKAGEALAANTMVNREDDLGDADGAEEASMATAPSSSSGEETVESVEQQIADLDKHLASLADTTRAPETLLTSLSDQFPIVVMLQ